MATEIEVEVVVVMIGMEVRVVVMIMRMEVGVLVVMTRMEVMVAAVMMRMVEMAEMVKGTADMICKLGSRMDKWEWTVREWCVDDGGTGTEVTAEDF
jgi:hypothetical protein